MQQNNDTPGFQVVDRRPFANLDSIDISSVPEQKPRYPSYVEELKARVEETERQFQEKKKQIDEEIARTRARLEADFSRRLELEKQELLLPFLEILDNLERALAAASRSGAPEQLRDGIESVAALFVSRLRSLGVEKIPVLGQPFDPNLASGTGTIKVSDPAQEGLVLDEVQPGYRRNGQLLRPAQVRVGARDRHCQNPAAVVVWVAIYGDQNSNQEHGCAGFGQNLRL